MRSIEKISVEDYQPYVDTFRPDAFDPALTDYSTMHNGFGRDVVAAFRARGIRVGLYYSLLDWHHPDYPAFGDANHPMRDNTAFEGRAHDFDRYLDYMDGQVRELCTNYGDLDILWFDFSYDAMTAEKWRAAELIETVRELQPNVLIDNRLEASGGAPGTIVTEHPTPWAGDFASPEQIIPAEGVTTDAGEPVPWEACITLNNNWGYHVFERQIGPLALTAFGPDELATVRLVADDSQLRTANAWIAEGNPGIPFVPFGPNEAHSYALPDAADTVLALTRH